MFALGKKVPLRLAAVTLLAAVTGLSVVRSEARSVVPGSPSPKSTSISSATAGPVLTVENTGTVNTSAILGSIVAATSKSGVVPTAVIGSATGTTGQEQGVYGVTTTPTGAGVAGVGLNDGVYGRASAAAGTGIYGVGLAADSIGVYGDNTYAPYDPPSPLATFPPKTETNGVVGAAADGNGVAGYTSYPYLNGTEPSGVLGDDTSTTPTANNGVTGITTDGNGGVVGIGKGTGANNPDVGPSTGVIGEGPVGVVGYTSATAPPATSSAGPFGAVIADVPYGAASTDTYYEFLALGTQLQPVFSVDQTGNVKYTGKLTTISSVGNGAASERTIAEVARPTLEDMGESALHGGAAYVAMDPSFAASIDARMPYLVFVTPGGEANQLYVMDKTSRGFWVRETRGMSSIPFDYRIVAYPKGDVQRRIAIRPENQASRAVFAQRREHELDMVRDQGLARPR